MSEIARLFWVKALIALVAIVYYGLMLGLIVEYMVWKRRSRDKQ